MLPRRTEIDTDGSAYSGVADGDGQTTAPTEADVDVGGHEAVFTRILQRLPPLNPQRARQSFAPISWREVLQGNGRGGAFPATFSPLPCQ